MIDLDELERKAKRVNEYTYCELDGSLSLASEWASQEFQPDAVPDLVLALIERVRLAEKEVAALREHTRWIPIGERLPEEGQKVYVLKKDLSINSWHYSKSLDDIFIRMYTHWMIPIPPQEGEE
jgi:hypothetical protein